MGGEPRGRAAYRSGRRTAAGTTARPHAWHVLDHLWEIEGRIE